MMHFKKSMLIVTLIVLFSHILFAVAYFQPISWQSIAQAAYKVSPSKAPLSAKIAPSGASAIDNSPQVFDTPEMLDMLVAGSDLIVRGRVIAQASRWNSDKSDVETHTVIKSLYTISGEAPNTLVIHTKGGLLADEGFATHDSKAANFEMDQEVLVFVYAEDNHYRVVGDEWGEFLVGKSIAVHEAQQTYTALHMLYSDLKFYLLNLDRTVTLPYDWDEIEPDTEEILLGQGFDYSGRRWGTGEIKFKVNINTSQAGEDDGSVEDFLDTVINAAETWSRVNTSNFILTYDGPTDNTETGINGSNDIVFEHRGTEEAVAKARYWFNPETGIIQEADIWINDDFQWNATGNPEEFELDLQTAVLHEMGHWLALGHDTTESSIMYFSLPGGLAKRGLHNNDKEGISFIYPCLQGDCIPAGLAPEDTATSTPATSTPTVRATATRLSISSPTPTVRVTATTRPTSSPTPTVQPTATTRHIITTHTTATHTTATHIVAYINIYRSKPSGNFGKCYRNNRANNDTNSQACVSEIDYHTRASRKCYTCSYCNIYSYITGASFLCNRG